jgi:hypothetical protein
MALNDSGSSSFFDGLPVFFSNTFHLDVWEPVSLSAETSSSISGTSSSESGLESSESFFTSGGASPGPEGANGVTGGVTTGVATEGALTAGSAAGVNGCVTTGVAAG